MGLTCRAAAKKEGDYLAEFWQKMDYTLPWPPHSRPHNISAFNIWAIWLNYNIWAIWLNYNIWALCSILQYLGLMFSTSYRDRKKSSIQINDNVLCWSQLEYKKFNMNHIKNLCDLWCVLSGNENEKMIGISQESHLKSLTFMNGFQVMIMRK